MTHSPHAQCLVLDPLPALAVFHAGCCRVLVAGQGPPGCPRVVPLEAGGPPKSARGVVDALPVAKLGHKVPLALTCRGWWRHVVRVAISGAHAAVSLRRRGSGGVIDAGRGVGAYPVVPWIGHRRSAAHRACGCSTCAHTAPRQHTAGGIMSRHCQGYTRAVRTRAHTDTTHVHRWYAGQWQHGTSIGPKISRWHADNSVWL